MQKYIIKGISCSSCAENIEKKLQTAEGMYYVKLNFPASTIFLKEEHLLKAQSIINKIEPGVIIEESNNNEKGKKENKNWFLMLFNKRFAAIIISFILLLCGIIFPAAEYFVLLPAYFLVGWKVIKRAIKNTLQGKLFEEHFLMSIATVGAIIINQLPEAVGVMLFFSLGDYLQDLSVERSRKSIKDLINLKPESANLLVGNNIKNVEPADVQVGEIIVVKPGEKVPLDGIVVKGESFLDTSPLTGESVPRRVKAGQDVLAGMINTTGLLKVKVTKTFQESSAASILEMVENASNKKAPTEKFITKFSRVYTPFVVFAALSLAVIPALVIPGAIFSEWAYRALILLVVSCPCALVVSIPLGYFGGIGCASKEGILIKGANFLEALTELHTVVFDKTGTLTKGTFRVSRIDAVTGHSKEEILKYAAAAETNSHHPIARSILEAYGKHIPPQEVEEYEEISGLGIKAKYKGKEIIAGSARLLKRENVALDTLVKEDTVVYVAVNGKFIGNLVISDEIKEDSADLIPCLKKLGIKRTVTLTGDNKVTADKVAEALKFDRVYSNLLPQEKVAKLEELLGKLKPHQKLAFVGDGLNDAPVITRADIGIAMGALGSAAAIEAADVVIMDDKPSKVTTAVDIARYTKRIVKQNIAMALGIKGIVILLAAIGIATMWEAVFADVGVALLAIYNSTRTLKYKSSKACR